MARKYPGRSAQRGGHQVSTASAPADTAARVSAAAWRSDGAPVPAITGTSAGTAARTASISSVRSRPVRVPASPVVPLTSTAAMPRPARLAASLPVESGSISPSASNRVTSATPTPLNSGAGAGVAVAGVAGSSVVRSGAGGFGSVMFGSAMAASLRAVRALVRPGYVGVPVPARPSRPAVSPAGSVPGRQCPRPALSPAGTVPARLCRPVYGGEQQPPAPVPAAQAVTARAGHKDRVSRYMPGTGQV